MRKLVLLFSTLLISVNVLASTGLPHNLGTEMLNALQKKAIKNIAKNTTNAYPIIYGGQDISRKVLATAHESVWNGQSTFVG